MGRQRLSRTHHARRHIKRAARTRARTKDLDQIHEDLGNPEKYEKLKAQDIDADLPGLAQHYCIECSRYFIDDAALVDHVKSKVHRRRLKNLKDEAYTQSSADLAVGLTTEHQRPSHVLLSNDMQIEDIQSLMV